MFPTDVQRIFYFAKSVSFVWQSRIACQLVKTSNCQVLFDAVADRRQLWSTVMHIELQLPTHFVVILLGWHSEVQWTQKRTQKATSLSHNGVLWIPNGFLIIFLDILHSPIVRILLIIAANNCQFINGIVPRLIPRTLRIFPVDSNIKLDHSCVRW